MNQGDAYVTDEFWVDVYINPDPAPTAVNQIWEDLADEGLVWGVTAGALPLAPGEAITLTVGGDHVDMNSRELGVVDRGDIQPCIVLRPDGRQTQ